METRQLGKEANLCIYLVLPIWQSELSSGLHDIYDVCSLGEARSRHVSAEDWLVAAQFIPDMLAGGSKESRIWKTLDICAVKQLHMCGDDDLSPFFCSLFLQI